ncbi:dihydrofolate reductase-like domain-containing protein [Mycena metata]|uniref:2,5-diamino-6-ribosylamino-4(3H)-pyrimidinone 5'-phosphate reductase n=1 Tax=Mycena metata TaxID=1033252 RepID=A0AAD7DM49_9AGAR|nr:dihydrofolate reductase-like domain-containing protein [Mycena metata]
MQAALPRTLKPVDHIDGVKIARKCSQTNVLGKAVEYVRVLNRELKTVLQGLPSCGASGSASGSAYPFFLVPTTPVLVMATVAVAQKSSDVRCMRRQGIFNCASSTLPALVLLVVQMANPPEYLTSLFASYAAAPPETHPFVTLTFAQSLDGKIAGAGGKQLPLSGPEIMLMTHWLRTLHVGSGTALNDNPQLNRGRGGSRGLSPANRLNVTRDGKLAATRSPPRVRAYFSFSHKSPHPCTPHPPARQEPPNLMVEGGAAVISAFGACATTCVDTILITTAPRLVGAAGVGYEMPEQDDEPGFHTVETRLVGAIASWRSDAMHLARRYALRSSQTLIPDVLPAPRS